MSIGSVLALPKGIAVTTKTLYHGQTVTATTSQFDGDNLAFDGNVGMPRQTASVMLTGAGSVSGITDIATTTLPAYEVINLMPGAALTSGGLTLTGANLAIVERAGAQMTFNGTSQITGGGILTATGFGGAGAFTVNGTMNIGGSSTVNMDYVAVAGTGTIHLTGENALLRAGSVGAGETVVLDGGTLSLTNGMSFLATIRDSAPAVSRIGPISSVHIYNAMTAVQETFNRATGELALLDAQGKEVADLKFAGSGDLYAAPTTGLDTNYIAISSHPLAGALPLTITA
jgi:hypothetical protein